MDKLFEDWRKYLLVEFKGDPVDYAPEPPEEEPEEEEEESLPEPSLDPAEGREWLESALSLIRTHKEDVESAADRLIEDLPSVSDFWKDIFDADNWDRTSKDFVAALSPDEFGPEAFQMAQRKKIAAHQAKKPSEKPADIVKRYHENGTLKGDFDKWMDIMRFVLICRQTNIDETKLERVQKFTDFMGEGSSRLSKWIKNTIKAAGLGGGAATFAKGLGAAGGAPALATGALIVGGTLVVLDVGGWVATHINDRVRKKDMIELQTMLADKLGVEREVFEKKTKGKVSEQEFDKGLGITLEDDFHDAEFQVMQTLKLRPHNIPIIKARQTTATGDVKKILSLKEQELYDRWRELLTEDKK
jgi:hypothetical protein|tara:strand:- start:485 stop:1561 length:1077 start_codon:yes stop_codon:yes gene_type:complete